MTYRAWMYDQFGCMFAFVMFGDYNVLNVVAARQASMLGCTFDYREPMS